MLLYVIVCLSLCVCVCVCVCVCQCEVQVWLVAVMVVLGVWGGREGEARVTQLSLYTSGGQQDHRLCVLCQGQGEVRPLSSRKAVHTAALSPQWQVVVLSLPGLKQLFSIEVSANTSLAASKPGQVRHYSGICTVLYHVW